MFTALNKKGNLKEDFDTLASAAKALMSTSDNLISNLSNLSALLNYFIDDINWIGFYLYDDESNHLVLGPFQGLPACSVIKIGSGVCGNSF